ncbi:MAG: hypothetical protein ACR2L1_08150 [Pyrinomonadaceae bacterium]
MEVTEVNGSRFNLALERFKEGYLFNFCGVVFNLSSDGYLDVSVQTSWLMENTTEETALEDFKIANTLTDTLIKESPSFAKLVDNLPRRFSLIDDYKTGAVELCRSAENKIHWAKGMPLS